MVERAKRAWVNPPPPSQPGCIELQHTMMGDGLLTKDREENIMEEKRVRAAKTGVSQPHRKNKLPIETSTISISC